MAHLFSKLVIADALKNLQIPDRESKIAILQDWLDMYNAGSLKRKSEKEFEGVYSESLFGTILGYTSASSSLYTREKEPRNDSNGQKCDIGLGFYTPENPLTQAVVELKDAATLLDRPQQRDGNLSPVQQAFKYKPLYNTKWVIVSNFYEIRLYTDTHKDFESFTLKELVDPANDYEHFRRFFLLFSADRLIRRDGESETEKLLAKVRIEEEKISKEFYKEYKTLRLELMRDIWKNNRETQNADVIEKAQRIIDRIVFVCFCEDRGLLPQHELTSRIQKAKEIGFSPWDMLKKFFVQIDSGDATMHIPHGYNGGLFRPDASIDNLRISDAIVEQFIGLGRYDFSEDGGQLSVEILGHIFEQSISDIEEIRTQIENKGKVEEEKEEKKVSKRKKDGIFYTPAYIVEYIVNNSLGRYMREHEEKLITQYKLNGDIAEKTYRKREIEAYIEYQKILQNVKVLDPACGSGAFLVRVFDWLIEENKRVDKIIAGDSTVTSMAEYDSNAVFGEILRHNIYGVDLNEESVEITKLSLWLKSAVRGKKLVTLDNNIKCGNSLIDDPAVAGDKAFDWNTEFADIMASGGFDVIVGNPPYVSLKGKQSDGLVSVDLLDFIEKKYPQADLYRPNLFELFVWLGFGLVKSNGFFSFLIPDRICENSQFHNIRDTLITSSKIHNFVFRVDFPGIIGDLFIFSLEKAIPNSKHGVDIQVNFRPSTDATLEQSTYKDQGVWKYLNQKHNNIYERLNTGFELLGDLYETSVGFIGKKGSIVKQKEVSTQVPCLKGENIKKYVIKGSYYFEFKKENLVGGTQNIKKLNAQKKIFLRKTGIELFAAYDSIGSIPEQSAYIIYNTNEQQDNSLLPLLCILNSRVFIYFYQNFLITNKDSTPQIKKMDLDKFPIPTIPLSDQQGFIDRADSMLALHQELHDKNDGFLKNISTKYKIEKITRKLEKWWELDFAEFVRELKVKLSLEEQEELMTYFNKRKTEIYDIVARIDATDKEIDEMVFELYGLSEEEKRVVLESNKK